MAEFHPLGLKSGIWSGRLIADDLPARLLLVHLGQPIAIARTAPVKPGEWQVEVDLPGAILSDGMQTLLLIADDGDGLAPARPGAERLATLALIAGDPLNDDLRAEIDLMRAELDLLKRELRRMAQGG